MTEQLRIGRPKGRRSWEFDTAAAVSARLRKGLTQRQLAKRCFQAAGVKVSDSNIAKYERGDICPSPQTLAALAKGLGVATDDLITFPAARAA